jgi:hypothetical protein
MKTLILLLFTVGLSAQNNQPTTPMSGTTTGTENITGVSASKIKAPAVNPERTETTASSATKTTSNTQPITNYGRNNDGSSTGTTVTGNGSTSDSAPVDDGSAHPGDKAGNWIVTPRGR